MVLNAQIIPTLSPNYTKFSIFLIIAVYLAIFILALTHKDDSDNDKQLLEKSEFLQPIQRDFDAIMEEGVIRMATRFNSSIYFIHFGEPKGFEYEFAKAFAGQKGLRLEVVVPQNGEDPIELLNSGQADFIAANFSITPQRKQHIKFSTPYNFVDQLMVFAPGVEVPTDSSDFDGMVFSVREGSSYIETLQKLKNEKNLSFEIEKLPEVWDTEAILYGLIEDRFQATIIDENLLQAIGPMGRSLQTGSMVIENDEIAWGIRSNAPKLKKEMDAFVSNHVRVRNNGTVARSEFMNILLNRYYNNRPSVYNVRQYALGSGFDGVFSKYDELVQALADSAGIDWKLVLSVMAQESRFDPNAKSWAGAVGLMQIIPRFSDVSYDDLYDPEINIREGIRILNQHIRHYSYMDYDNNIAFALAAYNLGMGHMADARRLTIDRNRNPNEWNDVAESLLLLMEPEYYQKSRFGYKRGIETVNYVSAVVSRLNMYKSLMMFAEEDPIRDTVAEIISVNR